MSTCIIWNYLRLLIDFSLYFSKRIAQEAHRRLLELAHFRSYFSLLVVFLPVRNVIA